MATVWLRRVRLVRPRPGRGAGWWPRGEAAGACGVVVPRLAGSDSGLAGASGAMALTVRCGVWSVCGSGCGACDVWFRRCGPPLGLFRRGFMGRADPLPFAGYLH